MTTLTTVMPVYNGERFLAQALQSVARQTRRPDRVVLLDDGSTDRTAQIVAGFKDLPCEYRRNETNLGVIGNHDHAFSFAAETDLLHIFHQDDLLKPEFYERMLPIVQGIPGRGMAWCGAEGLDAEGRSYEQPIRQTPGPPRVIPLNEYLERRLRFRADMYVCGTIFKTARQPAPCHWPAHMKNFGDHVFYARWATHCVQLIEVHEELIVYRSHEDNTFKRNLRDVQALIVEDHEALQIMEALRPSSGFARWLRRQRLQCFYAALAHSKAAMVKDRPAFAQEVLREARRRVNPVQWTLGTTAFRLREVLRRLRG